MQLETAQISDLKPHPRNPRIHPDSAIDKLVRSISEFGWTNPVLVSADGLILAGHARVKAASKAGLSEVPIIRLPLAGSKADAYLIADNKLQDETEWDLPELKDLLEELDTGEFDVTLTGFDLGEIEDLMTQFHVPSEGLTDDDEIPEQVEAVCKTGDLWLLGGHRLLCGDSTKAEDVARLMDGEKADMVFTDPPYGIGKDIENDDMAGNEFLQWNKDWVSILPTKDNVNFVSYHSTRTFPSLLNASVECGWSFEKIFFFYRPDKFPAHTWNNWMMTSQAILLFSKGKPKYKKVSPAHQDVFTVTSSGLGKDKVDHPTQKPVSHLIDMLSHFEVDIVADLFGGSGSTLIACEKLNRRCFMMEIDEHYCDVIIKRWEDFTGRKAAHGD